MKRLTLGVKRISQMRPNKQMQSDAAKAAPLMRGVMRIRATPLSAALSGFILVFASSTLGVIMEVLTGSRSDSELAFVVFVVIFFLLPFAFFVIGIENINSKHWNPFTKVYWESLRPIVFRGLCFFFSAATFGMAYAFIINELIK